MSPLRGIDRGLVQQEERDPYARVRYLQQLVATEMLQRLETGDDELSREGRIFAICPKGTLREKNEYLRSRGYSPTIDFVMSSTHPGLSKANVGYRQTNAEFCRMIEQL